VYVFYTSARSLVYKLSLDAVMAAQFHTSGALDYSKTHCSTNVTAATHMECVRKGVSEAMWSLQARSSKGNECYPTDESGKNLVGMFHLSALAIVVFFILVILVMFFRSGSRSFQSGKYLVFTWGIEHHLCYRFAGALLLVWTVGAIVLVFALASGKITHMTLSLTPVELLHIAWTDMALLLFSSLAFVMPHNPAFDWRSTAVEETEYHRSLIDLVTQSNDSFAQSLTDAIVKAQLGNSKQIDKMVPDTSNPLSIFEGRSDSEGGSNYGTDDDEQQHRMWG